MIILVVLNTMFESAKTEKLKKKEKGNHELKFVKMMLLFHMLLTL